MTWWTWRAEAAGEVAAVEMAAAAAARELVAASLRAR
jgi:hypothetical protein